MNSGDQLDFGVAEVDFFGRGPVPVIGPYIVKNVSNGPVEVIVTGDFGDSIVPLFGPSPGELVPAPDNGFVLDISPPTGDMMMGYLGLRLLDRSPGDKNTTIIFRATEPGGLQPLPMPEGPINAVVVKDWGNCSGGALIWDSLNANWANYGETQVTIDYSDANLCGGATLTYDNLVANGADVVIISDSVGGGKRWTGDEIQELVRYLNDGHIVIATYATFQFPANDNRNLAPIFGLRSDLSYSSDAFVTPTYNVISLSDTLFDGLGNPFVSSGLSNSQVDTADGIWDNSDLAGASIVAQTPDQVAVVTYYNPGPYIAVYISNMPEFNGGVNDERFFYNAIVNLWASSLGVNEASIPESIPVSSGAVETSTEVGLTPPRIENGTNP